MGNTPVYKVDPRKPDNAILSLAGAILRSGGTVAFPTETVYGLGANALDEQAVRRIFEAKARPPDNPLIVHVSSHKEVQPLVTEIPPRAATLMKVFWPGPLTILFKRSPVVPDVVTAGLDTVGIRMPDHPVALELIHCAGVPVAAPSANISSYPSPTTADHVLHDLDGRIDAIIDGGQTGVGVESTVLDISGDKPVILRPGYVTAEDLKPFVSDVTVDSRIDEVSFSEDEESCPRSPGQKYRHYSPKAEIWLVELGDRPSESAGKLVGRVISMVQRLLHEVRPGRKTGVLASEETAPLYKKQFGDDVIVMTLGSRHHLREVASSLFGSIRLMDDAGVEVLVAEGFPETGVGLAIMNRLRRASTFRSFPGIPDVIVKNGGKTQGSPKQVHSQGGDPSEDERKENREKDRQEDQQKDQEENGRERRKRPFKVLFVCTGNTCRSPMAEGLFNHLSDGSWVAESAGTAAFEGDPASPQAFAAVLIRGIDISAHRSRRASYETVIDADLILTMTCLQRDTLRRQVPSKAGDIFTLKEYLGVNTCEKKDSFSDSQTGRQSAIWGNPFDIHDPFGSTIDIYQEILDEIEECISALLEKLSLEV